MTVLDAAIAWGILGFLAGSLATMILFTVLEAHLNKKFLREMEK